MVTVIGYDELSKEGETNLPAKNVLQKPPNEIYFYEISYTMCFYVRVLNE